MNNLKNAEFMERFPPALKKDKSMSVLGRLIAEELHITANEAHKNIIYANIDELTETWLDVLAYDLHVDWYDYDYPVEAKRAIIKDSVKVHQKLGTKAAVEMALGGIHPQSEIEEWFDYNGKPYHFRIVLDTTKSRAAADYDKIISTVDIYKRLTAHLDGLYYQCSMCVVVMPQTEYFLFSVPMTGKLLTGTYPHRNTKGVVYNPVIEIDTDGKGFIAESVPTGTKPYRNITFTTHDSEIVTDSDTTNYKHNSNQTGKSKAGTTPYIQTVGGASEVSVEAETDTGATKYNVDLVGTKPGRNVIFRKSDIEATTETEVEEYRFITGVTGKETTGKEPYRNTEPGINNKGMTTTADTESYQYEVKRCGSNRL